MICDPTAWLAYAVFRRQGQQDTADGGRTQVIVIVIFLSGSKQRKSNNVCNLDGAPGLSEIDQIGKGHAEKGKNSKHTPITQHQVSRRLAVTVHHDELQIAQESHGHRH